MNANLKDLINGLHSDMSDAEFERAKLEILDCLDQ